MNRAFTLLVTFIYIIACNTVKNDDKHQDLKRVWMLTEFGQFDKIELIKKETYLDLTQPQNAASKMGCNQLSFPYTIKNDKEIGFADGFATKMYCQDMQLENQFTKKITEVNQYAVEGQKLILTTKNGEKIVFVAQDWD
jgi:heat shock protein HslJ